MPADMGYAAIRLELGVRNSAAILANLYALDEVAQRAFKAEAYQTAHECRDLTALLAPYDTGFMSDHAKVVMSENGLAWEVGWDATDFFEAGLAFYPVFQEFGTRHMQAQPSLGPAFEDTTSQYPARLGKLASEAMGRRWRAGR